MSAGRGAAGDWLSEDEAAVKLAEHGVAYTAHELVQTLDAARQAARRVGYPVVLKVVSADVVHKSDVGGVALDIGDSESLARSWNDVLRSVRIQVPEALIEGLLVAAQARPGLEVIVGGRRDPLFGSVLALGLGGTLVELLGEVALRLAPIDDVDAQEMIDETKLGSMLAGLRGSPPLDRDALVDLLLSVSDLLCADEGLQELDLNPVRVYEHGCLVLDVRMRMADRRSEVSVAISDLEKVSTHGL